MSNRVALIQTISETTATPDRVRWLYIQLALERCRGNISATARRLNMHRRTLQRILERGEPTQ